jgi:hypothetical protein
VYVVKVVDGYGSIIKLRKRMTVVVDVWRTLDFRV